jgi:hypothetical protein
MEERSKRLDTCPQGVGPGHPRCFVTTTTETVPVTRLWSTATYGPDRLTLAQLVVLSDPNKWKQRIEAINDHREACEHANVPRWLGTGLLAGGLGLTVVGAKVSDPGMESGLRVGGIAALGLGIASYIAGYVAFGGARCNTAQHMTDSLPSTTETRMQGREYAEGMRSLADDFNARVEPSPVSVVRSEVDVRSTRAPARR